MKCVISVPLSLYPLSPLMPNYYMWVFTNNDNKVVINICVFANSLDVAINMAIDSITNNSFNYGTRVIDGIPQTQTIKNVSMIEFIRRTQPTINYVGDLM